VTHQNFSMYPQRVILVVSLCVAAGCGRGDSAGAEAPAFPPADVQTVTLEPKPVPRSSEFVATVQSLRSTTVQPQVDGFVRRIFIKAGDRVAAGAPLVQIDPDRQQAALRATESQRAAREAELTLAGQQLDRMRALHKTGAVSRSQLDEAESAQKTAEAQLKEIEAQIRESQVELEYYRLTAPTSGVVGDIPVRLGDRVTPATTITTIDQAEGLEVYLNVPLERASDLKPGLGVELLDADGRVIASNPITFIAPRADDATQSVLVKSTLTRMPPGLRVMQYVRARVVWSNEPALTVPVLAVNRLAGQHFVFVAEPAGQGFVARQKPVQLGDVSGDEYVVRGGLQAGQRVIVSNLQKIGEGAPVKPS
jgi:RND family efflux transporter MFP subunit